MVNVRFVALLKFQATDAVQIMFSTRSADAPKSDLPVVTAAALPMMMSA
jgi:hypothetical protein